MKAVNLYFVTRPDTCEAVSKLYNELSCRDFFKNISSHEAATLRALVEDLTGASANAASDTDLTGEAASAASDSDLTGTPADIEDSTDAAADDIPNNNPHNSPLPLILLDGFFFSYTIEHIGKEFDLLKVSEDTGTILNVELKSEDVSEDRIRKQLSQNRYYLSHISRTIYSFTYVMETRTLYRMNDRGYLRPCPMSELRDTLALDAFRTYISEDLDHCFRASDYLISPVGVPEKFLQGQYFLTNQQFDFRRQILFILKQYSFSKMQPPSPAPGPDSVSDLKEPPLASPVIAIAGIAGTGKTLLLFDVGMAVSRKNTVLLIHGGPLREGHRILDSRLQNIDICSPDDLLRKFDVPSSGKDSRKTDISSPDDLLHKFDVPSSGRDSRKTDISSPDDLLRKFDVPSSGKDSRKTDISTLRVQLHIQAGAYTYIFIDEANRLDADMLDAIFLTSKERGIPVVLTYDPHKLLDESDKMPASDALIRARATTHLEFSGNIRINRPVYAFMRTLFHLTERNAGCDYRCIDVLYADSDKEAELICNYYKESGYTEIPVSPSSNDILSEEGSVIAQEYRKVLMVLDRHFYYDETSRLRYGTPHAHPESDTPLEIMYEALSRTRENLCLIICGNEDLFAKIMDIRMQ